MSHLQHNKKYLESDYSNCHVEVHHLGTILVLTDLGISARFDDTEPSKSNAGTTYVYVKVEYSMATQDESGEWGTAVEVVKYTDPFVFEIGTAENEWIVSVVCPSILVGDTLTYASEPKWGDSEYSFQYYFGGTDEKPAGFYDLPFTFPGDADASYAGKLLVVSEDEKTSSAGDYCISEIPGKYKIIANVASGVVDDSGETVEGAVVYEYFVTNNTNNKTITDVALNADGKFVSSGDVIANATLVDGIMVDSNNSPMVDVQIIDGELCDSDDNLISGATIPSGVFVIATSSNATGISTMMDVGELEVTDGKITSDDIDLDFTALQFADLIVVGSNNEILSDVSVNYLAIETISKTFDVLNTAVYTKNDKDFDNLRDKLSNEGQQAGIGVSQVYSELNHYREFTMLFDFQYTNFDNATTDEEKDDSDYDESKTLHFVSYPALPVGTEISWLDLTGDNGNTNYDEAFYHHTVTNEDVNDLSGIMALSTEDTFTLMGVYDEENNKVDDIDKNPFDISVRTKYQIHIEFPDNTKLTDANDYQFMLYKGDTEHLIITDGEIDQSTSDYKARIIVDSNFTLDVGDEEIATIVEVENSSKGGDYQLETTADIYVNHDNENYVAITLKNSDGENINFPVGSRIYMDGDIEPLVLRGGFAVFDFGTNGEHTFRVENLVDAQTYELELDLCTNVEEVAYPLSDKVAGASYEADVTVTAPEFSISATLNADEDSSDTDTRLLEAEDLDQNLSFDVTYTQSKESETAKYVTVITQQKVNGEYTEIANWYSGEDVEIKYLSSSDELYGDFCRISVQVSSGLSDGTYRILFQIVDDEGKVYAECPYNMIKR